MDPNPSKYLSYLVAFVSSLPYLCILALSTWLSDNFKDCKYQSKKCIGKLNEQRFTSCLPQFAYSVVDRKETISLDTIHYSPSLMYYYLSSISKNAFYKLHILQRGRHLCISQCNTLSGLSCIASYQRLVKMILLLLNFPVSDKLQQFVASYETSIIIAAVIEP